MRKMNVLHIGTSGGRGGIESFIMNVCSHLDREKYQFSIIADCEKAAIASEFERLGGKIYYIPSAVKDKLGYIQGLWRVLDKNKFDIVHIHKNSLANPAALYLCYFKGIKKIILHSHNTQPADVHGNIKAHKFFKKVTANMHLIRLACSEKAAEWMYMENAKYELIHNGIQVDNYRFNTIKRQQKRKELEIDDNIVAFCAIGRLTKQKNPLFLIDIFTQIRKNSDNCRLYLIGDGIMAEEVRSYAKKFAFYHDIQFLGVRDDIPNLLQAMDMVLMPSLYEGLPIAAVEAQAAGLPILISDNVDKNVKLAPVLEYDNIQNSPQIWAEHALQLYQKTIRIDMTDSIVESGYDIGSTATRMHQIYTV